MVKGENNEASPELTDSRAHLDLVLQQNALLAEQNNLLKELLGLTPEKLRTLLESLPNEVNRQSLSLTEEEAALFQRIEGIDHTNESAKEQVADELKVMKNKRLTKSFVKRLQEFLKIREWGIETDDGIPAAPVWQADRGAPTGGYMRLSYVDPVQKRAVQTKSFSYMPLVKIVSRPDLRKNRSADSK